MSAERDLAERIIRAWDAQPVDDDSGFAEKVVLARAYLAAVEALSAPSAVAAPSQDQVRIWSGEHRCWWRAGAAGYTVDIHQAGIFEREEAAKLIQHADKSKMLELRPVTRLSLRQQPCTCTGKCGGPEGLGEGWICCLSPAYVEHRVATGTPSSVEGITEEAVARGADVIARSPLIDAPKLGPSSWYGLARQVLEAACVAPPIAEKSCEGTKERPCERDDCWLNERCMASVAPHVAEKKS